MMLSIRGKWMENMENETGSLVDWLKLIATTVVAIARHFDLMKSSSTKEMCVFAISFHLDVTLFHQL